MNYFKQKTNFTCGPACARMMLDSLGYTFNEFELRKIMKTNKYTGTHPKGWINLSKMVCIGIHYNTQIQTIKDLIYCDYKLCAAITRKNEPPHYVVVNNLINNNFIINDPFYGENLTINFNEFIEIWYTEELFNSRYLLISMSEG